MQNPISIHPIFSIGHSVSNVERNHKVCSLIHTPKRNRLNNLIVDELTKGHLALRESQVTRRNLLASPSQLAKSLTVTTDEEVRQLEEWYRQFEAAERNVREALASQPQRHPTLSESAASVDWNTDPTSSPEHDSNKPETESENESLQSEPIPYEPPDIRTTRSGRTVRTPARLRDAIAEIETSKK